MIEQTQQVVALQSLPVVAFIDVQHPVFAIKIGELKAFFCTAKENQANAEAR